MLSTASFDENSLSPSGGLRAKRLDSSPRRSAFDFDDISGRPDVDTSDDDYFLRTICTVMAGSMVDRVLSEHGLLTTPTAPPSAPEFTLPAVMPLATLPAAPPMTPSVPRRMAALELSRDRLRVRLEAAEESRREAQSLLSHVETSARAHAAELIATAELHAAETSALKAQLDAALQQCAALSKQTTASAQPSTPIEWQERLEAALALNGILRTQADAALALASEHSTGANELMKEFQEAGRTHVDTLASVAAQRDAAEGRAMAADALCEQLKGERDTAVAETRNLRSVADQSATVSSRRVAELEAKLSDAGSLWFVYLLC